MNKPTKEHFRDENTVNKILKQTHRVKLLEEIVNRLVNLRAALENGGTSERSELDRSEAVDALARRVNALGHQLGVGIAGRLLVAGTDRAHSIDISLSGIVQNRADAALFESSDGFLDVLAIHAGAKVPEECAAHNSHGQSLTENRLAEACAWHRHNWWRDMCVTRDSTWVLIAKYKRVLRCAREVQAC
jgi:hypothetical protein